MKSIMDQFNEEERVEILELARVAINTESVRGVREFVAEQVDLSDEYLDELLEKINNATGGTYDDCIDRSSCPFS